MAKLSGAIGGILQGKTGSVNTRYSKGVNVVSQYVPNIRNPKTSAQLAQRFRMKTLSKLFSDLDSRCVRIAYGQKVLSGSGPQLILNELAGYMKDMPADTVPSHSWFRHLYRVIVDKVRGRDDDKLSESQILKSAFLISDQVSFSFPQKKDGKMYMAFYKTDKDYVLRANPNFITVLHDGDEPGQPQDLLPWMICVYQNWEYSDLDQEEFLITQIYYNFDAGNLWTALQIGGDLEKSVPITSVVPNMQENNFFAHDSENRGLYMIDPKKVSDLPLSKITKRYGMNFNLMKDSSLQIQENFDFGVELPTDAFDLVFNESSGSIEVEVTLLPEKLPFTLTGNEKIFFAAKTLGSDFKTITPTAFSNAGELTKTFVVDTYASVKPIRMLLSLTVESEPVPGAEIVPETIVVKPLSIIYRGDSTLPLWEAFWGNYNENPFRFPQFSRSYNFAMRFFGKQDDLLALAPNFTVEITDSNNQIAYTGTTNALGCIYGSIDDDVTLKSIKLSSHGIDYTILLDDVIYKDQYNYLGTRFFNMTIQ